ncbi:tRNA-dihydrouridine(47) synthase [NAD(P)(+)]-like isoform X2 [Bombina bombina]|uniref:tRNA-dihydrouridine(47) synthase [NAD(P)(+)]-like isoform X2 n=1 Tax=Bombina bombina TaxID=8345 RepID=UPI00235A8029|nr:tRNA-dihydrouridine(47) synthase [NAD(P)(+)]-like isoform X2 [Bombina bombina]
MADGDNKGHENGKLEDVTESRDKGVAAIKPQFLTTKEQLHTYIDNDGKEDIKQEAAAEISVTTEDLTEPEAKKIKLDDASSSYDEQNRRGKEDKQEKKRARGQNKNRPHMKHYEFEQKRLCPSVTQECASKCFFGEKCKFLHDVSKYMADKPADIGPNCHLFQTLGKCIYGVTCRFGKSHTDENFKNIINEELVKQKEGKLFVKNSLTKDIQQQLRKRKYSFEKSDHYLKFLNKSKKLGNSKSKPEPCVAQQVNSGEATIHDQENICTEKTVNDGKTLVPECSVQEDSAKQNSPDAQTNTVVATAGTVTDEDIIKLRPCEKKNIDFRKKLYLAPLTTCGNLPFRRICKRYGADITCGEMAMCTNLLQGQPSEWALLKRHHSEDIFGVQGGGCGLMTRTTKFEEIVKGMNCVLDVPLTVKIRTGVQEKVNLAHKLIPDLRDWGVSLITLHGRSREQRYTKLADWEYIDYCAKIANPLPLFGNGDILSYEDANQALKTGVSGIMIARGALVKPWLFTEIKEQRHWDISSAERFDILKDFTYYGLEHWGSDAQGVERTRRFMLEWLSFLCRYIPVGLLEHVPQKINERPPYYMGRDYMETLMASQYVADWIKISEMLLGPVPQNFTFLPKHKANSYK